MVVLQRERCFPKYNRPEDFEALVINLGTKTTVPAIPTVPQLKL